MRLWHDPGAAAAERSCCSPETVRLARASARALGIPHLTLDVAEPFREVVVEDFIAGYRDGRTPNPCVTCNGRLRFRALADAAALLGARLLSTGHYARVEHALGGAPVLARAADRDKDQSYMLSMLDRATLDRVVFPLGDLRKDDVRERARAGGPARRRRGGEPGGLLRGGGGLRALPRARRGPGAPCPGPIEDEAGRRLGTHRGYWLFTVGQRRGIGIAGAEPLYVLATDPVRNAVTVGPRESLATRELLLDPVRVHLPLDGAPLEVRVRYRGRALPGRARAEASGLRVSLDEPADGVAAGQTAALYRDHRLVAAGTIAPSRSRHSRLSEGKH